MARPKQSQRNRGLSVGDLTTSSATGTSVTFDGAVPLAEGVFFDRPTPPATSFEDRPPVLNTPVPVASNASPSSAAYETALNVLLSLGTGNSHKDAARTSTPKVQNRLEDYFTALPHTSCDASVAFGTPVTELIEQFSTCALLPQDRVVQLLRHYRYNIAPWVSTPRPSRAQPRFLLLTCHPSSMWAIQLKRLA